VSSFDFVKMPNNPVSPTDMMLLIMKKMNPMRMSAPDMPASHMYGVYSPSMQIVRRSMPYMVTMATWPGRNAGDRHPTTTASEIRPGARPT
jgi:hypothetical protein